MNPEKWPRVMRCVWVVVVAIVFKFVWLAANLFDDRGGLPKQTEASGCCWYPTSARTGSPFKRGLRKFKFIVLGEGFALG